jgi:hypothetical protein
VASFLVGGVLQTPGAGPESSQGDPAGTWLQDPALFRRRNAFFVPATMDTAADVLAPTGASVLLDGTPLAGGPALTHGDWSLWRVRPSSGYHELETDDPKGMSVQVLGFSLASAYYYPAGANLKLLSQPPVIIP